MREVEGEIVILDQTSGEVHHLNATASLIWQACTGHQTIEEIAAWLAGAVGAAPDDVVGDVTRTIAGFERLGLLTEE
jgi:PqqD family protein of HPr-rel-A system